MYSVGNTVNNYVICMVRLIITRASHVAQSVKHLPAMQEAWVPFLGWEVALEKEMATHSSIFAWRIPWTEEPGIVVIILKCIETSNYCVV